MQSWWIRFVPGLLSIALLVASVAAGCERPSNLTTAVPPCCSITQEVQAVAPHPPVRPEPPLAISRQITQNAAVVVPEPAALTAPSAHNLCLIPHRPSFVVLHAFLI
jgi:hypothetical protein